MIRSRRSDRFTEWDGNISTLTGANRPKVRDRVSPTSLQHYAECGFRYYSRSVLGLNIVEEPEELETMDAAARGTLVHQVLERFFRKVKESGRPALNESWTDEDRQLLLRILDEELAEARTRGLTGREVYLGHESKMLRADLLRFLDSDEEFRIETGALPVAFEIDIPEQQVAGVTMRGRVDRLDITPDGSRAWVIDYKTGSAYEYRKLRENPLAGGTKLQLPAYLAAAADASEARALYWFITSRGGFERIEFDATPENLALYERTVEAIVEGVNAGVFPAVSGDEDDFYGGWKNCGFCEFDRMCSRRRDYELLQKLESGEMTAWLRVAEAARPPEVSE
jgi:CRISPR/Cas system-associated exonuclease Cas4 (RecB family)